jgi:predicted MFS family arabinose efflux permease
VIPRLIIFGFMLFISVLLAGAVVNHGFKKIHLSRALLYVCSVAMIGVLGEIFVDKIYASLFPTPLWRYNFVPVNHAYTSQFAPVL